MFKRLVKDIVYFFCPILKEYHRFTGSLTNHVSFARYVTYCLSAHRGVYWPVHKNSEVTHPNNIYVGINSNAGTRPGCYLQGNGGIWIGNYVHFASNIGIISANHSLYNQMKHEHKGVRIEDYCWIGMNVVVLPGVHLGPRTIVGAGSVVTKSFPDGYCVIAGNPARIIRELDKEKFVPTHFTEEYYGFVPKEEFREYASKYLKNNKYFNEFILTI
ncbi:MAG: acyltransferase [Bacteroidaceae bacterium]|nr:acyltransferase [Bacteroidaceae bacterium]